jgi:hypothetical protein
LVTDRIGRGVSGKTGYDTRVSKVDDRIGGDDPVDRKMDGRDASRDARKATIVPVNTDSHCLQ